MMTEKRSISKATGVMGAATMLSRVAGLARDMVIGRLFGAGYATDAFFMAFTIPNLLRRFFAEGSLTAAFVPTFSEVYHGQGSEEAKRVVNICWTLLVLVMALVTILGVLGSPVIVRLIGYGFGDIAGKLALTDHLNRVMFPYIFFVSLLSLLTGVLNVYGHFFLPALSPLFLNLAIIASALFLRGQFAIPVTALAAGVVAGGAIQLAAQWPVLRRHGLRLRPDFSFRHPVVRKIARLMLPGVAGVAIYQINVVVTRLLASFLPQGSVSYLYYGQRLFEFPQGIFVVSLAQAILPAMSRQAAAGDEEGLKDSLRFSLALIALVTIPAAVGLMLCSVPVYSLLFLGGEFSYPEVRQTALALSAYAPGLVFVGVSRVVVPTFYALKDTRTPVWISLFTLLANAGLGLWLMQVYAHVGLALALTLATAFNSIVLLWALRRKVGPLGLSSVFGSVLRMAPPAALMAAVVWMILSDGPWESVDARLTQGGLLLAAILAGMATFGVGCLLFRVPEMRHFGRMLRKKVGRER